MGVRVSVITPVYNMEETIEASVRSVLGQTLQDLELICVDDGSTDRTGAILDRLAQEDPRLRVIHQENRGVSAARNTGLASAAGETVAWLDGDDQMGPQALEKLNAALLEIGASMAICNYENVERSGAREKRYVQRPNEVISGEDEALFGYAGAMQELHLTGGAFLDIGGASTEIVTFEDGKPVDFASFPIGSLSLYRRCVKKILPEDGSLKRLRQEISKTIDVSEDALAPRALLVGVGGTARAALKLARHYYRISDDCRSMTAEQLDGLCAFLCSGKKEASDLILRLEAERIHTLVPGLLILQHVFHLFHAEQLVVGKYGVREGYLCQRILKNHTDIPKTGN